jgi:sulfate permease, SulP family
MSRARWLGFGVAHPDAPRACGWNVKQEPQAKDTRGVGDLIGGFVAGLYGVPAGIGYASLAGLNPMLGVYAAMVPVAVTASASGTVLLISTLTSSIALTVGGVLDSASYSGEQVSQAAFTMALLVGAMLTLIGVFRLGRIVNYISNSVLTGFVLGIAVLIIVGKFPDIFGYDPTGYSNKVVKAVDILLHPQDWSPAATAVGIGTIVAGFALKAIPSLGRYALIIVVLGGTAIVWALGLDIALVSDQATIPTGLDALPIPTSAEDLPDLAMIPDLIVGSVAISIVALAMGAGIRPAFPNPDGSRASQSRDFLAVGLGNIAGAFFQSPPTGGSLSRTAITHDGGARSRAGGFVAAVTVVILVVFFGPVVGAIPEAVIGGLLFIIGVGLVRGRLPDTRQALRTGRTPAVTLLATLVLTLTVPLQEAIVGGMLLSLAAYVVASASQGEMLAAHHDGEGWVMARDIPATLPPDRPLLLRHRGPNFFAEVPAMVDGLPEPDPAHPGVLVVDVGGLRHVTSTALKQLDKYQAKLDEAGSGLVLAGVPEAPRAVLARTGLLARLGEENVLPVETHLGGALDAGLQRGQSLLAELQAARGHDHG